ncbi:hypothetical protein OHS18_46260 [Amycolatopsis sp. NBC_00355]|uniref:hypothetical protein n=1 Tax=Amycolatopsis sp. NBC_00355 TaxID=2975957 RepID=UPI002E256A71
MLTQRFPKWSAVDEPISALSTQVEIRYVTNEPVRRAQERQQTPQFQDEVSVAACVVAKLSDRVYSTRERPVVGNLQEARRVHPEDEGDRSLVTDEQAEMCSGCCETNAFYRA